MELSAAGIGRLIIMTPYVAGSTMRHEHAAGCEIHDEMKAHIHFHQGSEVMHGRW